MICVFLKKENDVWKREKSLIKDKEKQMCFLVDF
jgi:hypothetical protein